MRQKLAASGGAVSTNAKQGSNVYAIWIIQTRALRTESVMDCLHSIFELGVWVERGTSCPKFEISNGVTKKGF